MLSNRSPQLLEDACAFLGAALKDAMMAGDNPATDGEGAINVEIRPMLVGAALPRGWSTWLALPKG